MRADRSLTVLYDRDCGLCVWTVRQLRGLDRNERLAFVALQFAQVSPRGSHLRAIADRFPLLSALHVVREDGKVRSRGVALREILGALPGGWLLSPWTQLPGAVVILNFLYDSIARHRIHLGRMVQRDVPIACAIDEAGATGGAA